MDHSAAIAALKDELEIRTKDAEFLEEGVAKMKIARLLTPDHIRVDAIMRWTRKLENQQANIMSLQATINFLEHLSLKED